MAASHSAAGLASEDIEQRLLAWLAGVDSLDSQTWAAAQGADHEALVGVILSLSADEYVAASSSSSVIWSATEAAGEIARNGSPEFAVWRALEDGPKTQDQLKAVLPAPVVQAGFPKAMQARWIRKGGAASDGGILFERAAEGVTDTTQAQVQALIRGEELSAKVYKDFKGRKLAKQGKLTTFQVTKGPAFAVQRQKPVADLDKALLESGEWETAKFKPYNFVALGVEPTGGHLHTLLKVRAEFRQILLEMGFSEMPTNRWVESSFWNFDALFQPQSHPARDAHDTFFVSDPASTLTVPEDFLRRVQDVHEHGGYGSVGYQTPWDRKEAMTNIMRTHTTAVSSRMLYELANAPGGFKPKKMFSIDRVFRNEALDATHLAEFHQVEGVVADYDLGLGDLIGVITEFFRRIGITQLRFKPAYNPYTEPSMEIFGYHPDLKKWTEIGNSGIFRPEMLRPMGLPENVVVAAWGLSLERPTMIKYRFSNIRDLFGHKVQMDMIKTTPIVRFPPAEEPAAASTTTSEA